MSSLLRHAGMGGVVAASLSVLACSDASVVGLPSQLDPGAVRYEIVAGDQQSAPAGTELPNPLMVRITTSTGEPLTGQILNWVVTEGDGSVFAGRGVTSGEGQAQEWWTLGDVPGGNTLEVRAVDSSSGEALVFARFRATGTDVAGIEPAAPPSTISLSVMGYKVKGRQVVDMAWSGASGTMVEVHRDGRVLTRTANDGNHLDAINRRGSASYRYRLCEAGGTPCSGELQVNF